MAEKKTAAKETVSKTTAKKTVVKKPVKALAPIEKTVAKKVEKPAAKPKVATAPAKAVASKALGATAGAQKVDASVPSVGLFQYFLPKQPASLKDGDMIAIKAPDNVTPLTHPTFIKELIAHPQTQGMRVWGLLPADYPGRLEMSGKDIRAAVEAAPGFDVYLFNPHIEIESLYENLWVQGEVSHPKLMALCADVFRHVGIDTKSLSRLQNADHFVTGQAVVATSAFWKKWLAHLAAFLKKTEALPEPLKVALYQGNADPKGRHANGTYLMFVTERLFADFVVTACTGFKVHRIRNATQESRASVYLKDLKTLRNLALNDKTGQLRGIWSSYRLLYLTATQGKEWVERNAHAFARTSGAV